MRRRTSWFKDGGHVTYRLVEGVGGKTAIEITEDTVDKDTQYGFWVHWNMDIRDMARHSMFETDYSEEEGWHVGPPPAFKDLRVKLVDCDLIGDKSIWKCPRSY